VGKHHEGEEPAASGDETGDGGLGVETEIAMATRRRPENLTAYDYSLRALQQYYLRAAHGRRPAQAQKWSHPSIDRIKEAFA
jgi:hypothetical protein